MKRNDNRPQQNRPAGRQEARPGEQQPAQAGRQRETGREEAFPGYPHYEKEEDMMSPGSPLERVRFDVEKLTPSGHSDGRQKEGPMESPGDTGRDDPGQAQQEGRPTPARSGNDDFDIGDEDYEELNERANETGTPEDSLVRNDTADENDEAEVSEEERSLLAQAAVNADESDDVVAPLRARPDETDEDGDYLNEASGRENRPGDDIDVPGSEQDDDNEAIGEEDEENNYYSLGGDRDE